MPRDGSNIYSQPFPDVVEDTTIESTVYNGFTNDVAQDLNAARPIIAGGTGATNAHDAMIALSGEIANQVVTNYDGFPFVSGSFYSAAGATAAPNAHAFAGICYINAASTDAALEARDNTDGKLYLRARIGGIWNAWVSEETYNDTRFVNVAGDTMSGSLTAAGALVSTGYVMAQNGNYYFNAAATKSLNYDGVNFNFNGGSVNVPNGPIFSGAAFSGPLTGDLALNRGGGSAAIFFGSSTKYLFYDGTNFSFAGGTLLHSTAAAYCADFNVNADGGNILFQRSNASVGSVSVTTTATAFNTSSDMRLKEDLKPFDAGRVVDDTEVYDFAWKKTGERSYGVVAQQAVEVYPAAVFHDEREDWWGIDYSKYVPVLLQELKALRTRVAELERKLGAGAQPARAGARL